MSEPTEPPPTPAPITSAEEMLEAVLYTFPYPACTAAYRLCAPITGEHHETCPVAKRNAAVEALRSRIATPSVPAELAALQAERDDYFDTVKAMLEAAGLDFADLDAALAELNAHGQKPSDYIRAKCYNPPPTPSTEGLVERIIAHLEAYDRSNLEPNLRGLPILRDCLAYLRDCRDALSTPSTEGLVERIERVREGRAPQAERDAVCDAAEALDGLERLHLPSLHRNGPAGPWLVRVYIGMGEHRTVGEGKTPAEAIRAALAALEKKNRE